MKTILNKTALRMLAIVALALGLYSCDSFIYDDEGDCAPYYKVRFVWDTNLRFVDAFPVEGEEVTLYVIDSETGRIVWQRHDSGEHVKAEGYLMDVDIEPGTYDLVAWCGRGHTGSFAVAEGDRREDLRCRLADRIPGAGGTGSEVRNPLGRLFHGKSERVVFEDEQGVHIKTVRLIKDTNDLHIVLQHLSGQDIDHRDYTFTVTGDNGHMDWDNSLLADEPVTYYAHDTYSGSAGIYMPDDAGTIIAPSRGPVIQVSAAVAHLSLGRLVKDNDETNDLRVNIHHKSGKLVASVPLVDYALLVRGKYRRPDGTPLTDQEYLDYQDDYSMVFFLDENGRWEKTQLYINSWRVILQNTDL